MKITYEIEALEYLSKLADGGMRDAITLLDKCLAYSTNLSIENVVKALGTVDYETMFHLTDAIYSRENGDVLKVIDDVHMSGKDLKQFIKTYTNFILDICKYKILGNFELIEIPSMYKYRLDSYKSESCADDTFSKLLSTLVKLKADIKWETSPKPVIQSTLLLFNL